MECCFNKHKHTLFYLWWTEGSSQAVNGWISIDRVFFHPPWKPVKVGRWRSRWWSKIVWHRWVGPTWGWGWWPGHRPGARLNGQAPHGCFHSTVVMWPPVVLGHMGPIWLMRSIPQRKSLFLISPVSVISSRHRADAVWSDPWWVQRVFIHILVRTRISIVISQDTSVHRVVSRWANRTESDRDYFCQKSNGQKKVQFMKAVSLIFYDCVLSKCLP